MSRHKLLWGEGRGGGALPDVAAGQGRSITSVTEGRGGGVRFDVATQML